MDVALGGEAGNRGRLMLGLGFSECADCISEKR
jgi:hypothetical protein